MRSKDYKFGIIGIVGAILCAISDILLDLKGPGSVPLGTLGIIESNWRFMSLWRFPASILLGAISIPMYVLGIIALKNQISRGSRTLGSFFGFFGYLGSLSGIFIHTSVAIMPIIYKALDNNLELSEKVIGEVFKGISIPFLLFYSFLVGGTSIITIISIVKGKLNVPKWYIALNPLVFLLFGLLLKVSFPLLFYELPSIVMPSLGIGAMGYIALKSSGKN